MTSQVGSWGQQHGLQWLNAVSQTAAMIQDNTSCAIKHSRSTHLHDFVRRVAGALEGSQQ